MRRWRRRVAFVSAAALLVVVAGCATTGRSGGDGQSRDVITRQEIMDADVSNLYQVVKRLRPEWFRVRSRSLSKKSEILVIRDGTVIGNVETLREIGRDGIEELRYLDGDTAAATLVGAREGFVEGAIVIERAGGS